MRRPPAVSETRRYAHLRIEEHHPPHRPVERARLPEPLLGQSDAREGCRAERAARLVDDRAQIVEGGDEGGGVVAEHASAVGLHDRGRVEVGVSDIVVADKELPAACRGRSGS